MSVLVIGGDQISQISSMLTSLGAKTINHWDARKNHLHLRKSSTRHRLYCDALLHFKP